MKKIASALLLAFAIPVLAQQAPGKADPVPGGSLTPASAEKQGAKPKKAAKKSQKKAAKKAAAAK